MNDPWTRIDITEPESLPPIRRPVMLYGIGKRQWFTFRGVPHMRRGEKVETREESYENLGLAHARGWGPL